MNEMTNKYKEILSKGIYDTVAELIMQEEDFAIVVNNFNDWNVELPERLKSHEQFILNINKQTLEDSYVDDDWNIVINTVFDDYDYTKVFSPRDISALLANDGKSPIMIKPFKETETNSKTNSEPEKTEGEIEIDVFEERMKEDPLGLKRSLDAFKINNPKMAIPKVN